MKRSIPKLLRKFRKTRSPRHFAGLYDLCTPRLYGMALRLAGGRRSEAEDLVQETWVRAVSALETFRGDSRFLTWLIGIMINCNRERDRRSARRARPEPEIASDRDDALDLDRLLGELPRGYREILLLHDLAGYTHAEIGEHFGIAEGTSKSQLSRARAAVRALAARQESST